MTHTERVAAYNAQQKRLNGVLFNVVETSTGRVIGGGSSLPYAFAKYVRDTRDGMSTGAFLVKRCN